MSSTEVLERRRSVSKERLLKRASWPDAHRPVQEEPTLSQWYDLALYMAPR